MKSIKTLSCGKQEILTGNPFPAITQEKKNRYHMIEGYENGRKMV